MILFADSSQIQNSGNIDNFFLPPNQPSIDAALDRARQTDIRVSNNACLDITIADLCHCMNPPDSLVKLSRFKKLAWLVTSDYKPPGRKKIGGTNNANFLLFLITS